MKFSPSLALLGFAYTNLAAAQWDDPAVDAFVNSIKTVDYNSQTHPDFTDSDVFDGALKEWKEKSKLYPSSKPSLCPKACSDVGADPAKWSVYADIDRLKACNETLLFDVNVFNKLSDGLTRTSIRVCTADFDKGSKSKRDEDADPEEPPVDEKRVTASVRYSPQGDKADSKSTKGLASAARQISNYLENKSNVNGSRPTIAFGSSGNVMMGLYTGHQARQQGIHETLLKKFLDEVEDQGASESIIVELCDSGAERGADYIVGIAASAKGDFTFVQDAAAKWAKGECVAEPTESARTKAFAEVDMDVPDVSDSKSSKSKRTRHHRLNEKRQDGTCKTRQVVEKDTCPGLAAKCGITPAQFTKYNDYDSKKCSNLVAGQHVCCSDGDVREMRSKPDTNGACSVYTTQTGDTCSSLAAANSLKISDISDFNKKTWNFPGCGNLWANIKICLSKGDPPMPAEVAEAKCGPAVPGTERPESGTDLADLNPCLLNACCNIWGNCGITAEFCTESESDSGAPGTAAPGENGCVSNCGVDIVRGDSPDEFIRIGYFEAWNSERPCLNMRADQIPTEDYTHIHFAFPDVTEDFKIDVSKMQEEFDLFKKLEGVKKIISLGGWAFSNEAPTVHILRNAVLLENQGIFRKNILTFLVEHDLDGIDIDWEYPEAMDIPGTPAGNELEGDLLAIFMNTLSLTMPLGKSVSFAAPASYWYLKAYPIKIMAPFVDYIVHMTYDLHGQWDYGNEFTSPGCPTGNCLRSHVNLTETFTALSMMTKAGMPSNKIAVGVTSYGRSFKMAEEGCFTESCLFTGTRDKSDAAPGICTGEAGYIANAEIELMREFHLTEVKDNELLADTIVYNDTEYVSYMTEKNKLARKLIYNYYNLGGTSDWAIDLQSFEFDSGGFNDGDMEIAPLEDCDGSYDNIDDIDGDKDDIPGHCIEGYIVGALGKMLEKALDSYDEILEDGYNRKFGYFKEAVQGEWSRNMGDFFNNHIDDHFDCYRKTNGEMKDHACPPYDGTPGLGSMIYLEVKDEEKLKRFLLEEYDIDWENVEYDDITGTDNSPGPGCNLGPCGLYSVYGVPQMKKDPEVPNPKDAVADSLSNLRKLPALYEQMEQDINVLYSLDSETEPEDIVDGAMLPVFMVQTATEAMEDVADIGEELEEAEAKMIINLIVTAILFIIPAVGSAISAVTGIAMIARIAAIAAEVGGAVYGAIDIAENPDNAAAGIFAIVLGFVGVGSAVRGIWKDAATLRRGLKVTDLANLGGSVKTKVDLVDSMVKVCRIR